MRAHREFEKFLAPFRVIACQPWVPACLGSVPGLVQCSGPWIPAPLCCQLGLQEPLSSLSGASPGPLGSSWGPIGAESSIFRFVFPLLGPSWGPPGAILGRLGRLLAVLEPSWAVLGPCWGPLGPSRGHLGDLLGDLGAILGASWAVGRPKRRKCQNLSKPNRKLMIWASSGPPRNLLEAS